MIAIIIPSEYGERHKKPPNRFFDILKKLELKIGKRLGRTINTVNLEEIDLQIYPLRN